MAKVKVKIRFISLTYLLKLFLLLCLSFVLLSGLCHLLDLHINVTSSLPYGLYKKVDKTDICKGDIILFCLEGEQAEFAKKRNYLTFGSCPNDMAPIGKKVIATKDDHITLNNEGIKVNGTLLEKTAPLAFDGEGRDLPLKVIDRSLNDNEYFTASQKEDSFDSRYFGVISKSQISGLLIPVFTFNQDHE